MEILNHLEDLSMYEDFSYTEEEKQMFVEFINLLEQKGLVVKYMRMPLEKINNKLLNAHSITFKLENKFAETAEDMVKSIITIIDDGFVFDNTIYVYNIGKINTNSLGLVYKIRLGKESI